MIIATATDRAFLELTCAMLASMAVHAPTAERVHVFGFGLARRHRERLKASFPRAGLVIHDGDIDIAPLIRHFPPNRRITAATYARIFIPTILAQETGRLAYIDADTVANASIDDFERIDLEGFAIGACADPVGDRNPEWNARLGSPPDTRYVNAGVLLIDLDAWRRQGLTQKIYDFLQARPEGLRMMDQDALNGAMLGQFKILDDVWNAYYPGKVKFADMDPAVFEAARIIHFVGRHKPNQKENRHPARSVFLGWRDRTPYARSRMQGPRERKLRGKLKARLKMVKAWLTNAVTRSSRG